MDKNDLNKLVSIIIPAYNIEEYIGKCLDSVLEQSYQYFEIILIDDGSIDQTEKICDDFGKKDCRIKVIHEENSGVSSARNIGIRQAKGKYILFIDGDDYVSRDYIETLVNCIETTDSGMGCADYYLMKDNNISTFSLNVERITELSAENAINLLTDKNSFQGYLWNKIFRRNVITQNRIYFDEKIKIWEDMLFCLKYLLNVTSVAYIRRPIYYYVQRNSSAMNDNSIWYENTQLLALEQMWDIIQPHEGKFKSYIRDYYANYLTGLLGKDKNADRMCIQQQIDIIDKINGNLSIKHKIKKELISSMPWITKFLH